MRILLEIFMGRPLTGKTHVGQRRETRPNGDVYVYERVTGYDPKTQKTKTLSTRLLGKIPAGSSEMVPTRPKKTASSVAKGPITADRKHIGLQKILEWAGRASGIDEDLQKCFELGDALKLSSIARYWVATDGDTLPRIESWQLMNQLPYTSPITQDVYGKLFACVGRDESRVQSYFRCRAKRATSGALNVALDTTTFSTYSKNQIEARQGFNKDADGLDTIKLLVLYSVEDREPIAFSKQPGNIPDRISLVNAAKQLEVLNFSTPVIVADNGFYSQANMAYLAHDHTKFMMLANGNDKWVRAEIDAAKDNLAHFKNICPFDLDVTGVMNRRQHEFCVVRQRTRGNYKAGEMEPFTRRLYVHIFYKPEIGPTQERRFRESLFSIKTDLENGVTEFRPSAQKMIDEFLTVKRTTRGVQVGFQMDKIEEAKRYWGYFVLVSNEMKEPFEALKAYRAREKIEELFATYKDSFDGRKPRTWYPENLYGRQFAQFIGLGYHCFLTKKILEVKGRLAERNKEGKTKQEQDLEEKLRVWLDQHSLIQILDWFRCVDFVAATGDDAAAKWTSETTQRDKLFLEMLGVS